MSRRPMAAAATALCLVLGLVGTACTGAPPAPAVGRTPGATSASAAAKISITPGSGSRHVRPGTGITVRVAHGTIEGVVVRGAGAPVSGGLNAARTVWRSRWALAPATRYTVRATATGPGGSTATATSSFRTLRPPQTFTAMIFEGLNQRYGVGMPIILSFSRPITNRRAVERSLELRTSRPVVGAWYWDGDRTLYFRPRTYWPAHTTVHFVGHLDGVEGAPGVYGTHTLTQTFLIGRSLIAVADTLTHRVRIYLDRRLFGNWPMSSGRPGDNTPNGTYLTIDKHNPVDMKGPGYNIEVPWSVRFTLSGDYLHDAYWSVNEQGFTNVSHGCVNLSPEHAKIYYKLAVPGDPVTITGSPRAGVWDNGWTVWFLSWRQLLGGSALHRAVRAGPDGSAFVDPATLPSPPAKAEPPLARPRAGNAIAS